MPSVNRVGSDVCNPLRGQAWRQLRGIAASIVCGPELGPGGDRNDSLRYGARIEAGLRAFLTDGGFRAFTTNFQDLGGLRQLPGLAVQQLMAEGYGFGGEGDWKTSVILHTIKAMGGDDSRGTSFMEDYTYHWGPGTPKILGAHMLEVCPSIAAGRPRIEIHPLGIGDREDPVRLVFDAKPGPAVVVGICDLGDRFRLVLNEITVVAPEQLAQVPLHAALADSARNAALLPLLAARDGALVPVIETAPGEPLPLWRLVAERAICGNTTAAGGNASLKTLGA